MAKLALVKVLAHWGLLVRKANQQLRDRDPTLSLCLIVRDAQRPLRAALESARPFMDEMIVVDTGSQDGGRETALEAGARVFDFAWCDDFSAARNDSLDRATGDWIFWMDADDVLPPESGRELRELAAAHPARDAAFWVTVVETSRDTQRTTGHAHVKLFPRHPAIRFCYHVHEQVAPAVNALGLPIKPSTATVHHAHADRSPQADAARMQRNLRLLMLDLAERPDDPFVLHNLGTTYLFLPEGLGRAAEYLRRSIAGFKTGSSIQLNAYLSLGQAYGTSGDRDAELHTYREALEHFPNDGVLLLRVGGLCERRGLLDEAADCYRTALERGRVRLSATHVRDGPVRAVLRLGRIYLKTGRRADAEQVWQQFLQKFPAEPTIRQALAELEAQARPRA